jgi:hypothetical protein
VEVEDLLGEVVMGEGLPFGCFLLGVVVSLEVIVVGVL